MIEIGENRRELEEITDEMCRMFGAVLLVGRPDAADPILPRTLYNLDRAITGEPIDIPEAGIRAYSPELVDAAVLFALRQPDEETGVHVDYDPVEGGRRITLMATDPDVLEGRRGFVAVVRADRFDPVPHKDGEPWAFINSVDEEVPIVGGATVTAQDLRLHVFRVAVPSRAFYEDPSPYDDFGDDFGDD